MDRETTYTKNMPVSSWATPMMPGPTGKFDSMRPRMATLIISLRSSKCLDAELSEEGDVKPLQLVLVEVVVEHCHQAVAFMELWRCL